jgi:hypothetical protein
VIVAARFNGPPDSGNGGYSAGLVASELLAEIPDRSTAGRTVEVTLRRPPPLDTELSVRRDGPTLRVHHGADLVAEAAPATLAQDEVVDPVDFAEAVAVSRSYRGFVAHPFPTCFVCGPDRPDGLRLFPGRLADGRTAAPFVPPPDSCELLVWAALDCPGGWSVPMETRMYLLGRIAARIDRVPAPGVECVVVGRLTAEHGRKAHVLTTLYSAGGDVLATARATWVAMTR